MKKIVATQILLLIWLGLVSNAVGVELPEIEGVFGLSDVSSQTYVAVWVPNENGVATAGVRWYQNDGSTICPAMMAMAGSAEWPGALSNATLLKSGVSGVSSAWNEIQFEQPIASDSEGLYLIFQLPEGSAFEYAGVGGGFGLGYYAGDGTRTCWLASDGVNWNPMQSDYRIAVQPITAIAKSAGGVLIVKSEIGYRQTNDIVKVVEPAGMSIAPNPFNPLTNIKYQIPVEGFTSLNIFDVRGRRVINLVARQMDAGEHSTQWAGLDDSGQRVASGVYFARLETGGIVLNQRLVMLK